MPHQTPDASKATAQNAATEPQPPNDQARGQERRPEPRSYAAKAAKDSALAPPAAGEVGDYADEGEALGGDGGQQGRDHTNRPHRTEALRGQGRLTRELNRRQVKSGSPDQGKL
jgi:hypothetical protein